MESIENKQIVENKETVETVEKLVEETQCLSNSSEIDEIEVKKPRKKMVLSDEERQKRSDRMKLARAKKNDELEKNRLLMQEYLKQQEDEYKQQIEKKITVKANRKKKELESEYIQPKVTEKKEKTPKQSIERAAESNTTEPVKQVSFFKVCN